jgi:hypothetical protein
VRGIADLHGRQRGRPTGGDRDTRRDVDAGDRGDEPHDAERRRRIGREPPPVRRGPADPDHRRGQRHRDQDDDENGADHGGVRPARAERLLEHVDGRRDKSPVVHRVERPVERLVEAEVEDPHDRDHSQHDAGRRRDDPHPPPR